MKKFLSIILSILICCSLIPATFSISADSTTEFTPVVETFLDRVKKDYKLVFSDEFNDDTLDTTKWQFDGQNTRRNSELQVYADSMADGNLEFDGESAVIIPKVETKVAADGKKFKYTSAEISTQNKHTWKYGYFEIRSKVSIGKNIVPAIWTLGYDYPSKTCVWPKTGEIDIIEGNSNTSVYSTLHYAKNGTNTHTNSGAGGTSFSHKVNEVFHNYWLYWTDKYLMTGCDEQINNIIDITTPDLAQSFRNYEQWLILNVALGMFSNPVNDSEEEQWKMWVDYARVYQLDNDALYDNYKAFTSINLKHNGGADNYTKNVSTYKGDSSLAFTMVDELEPGKYDVYVETTNTKGSVDAYINNTKTNEISYIDRGVNVGRQAYVGSVDLQDNSAFDIVFKNTTATSFTAKKFFFVKTEETKTTPVAVNQNSCTTVSNNFEVSTEAEFITAAKNLLTGGTIKLKNDLKLTKSINLYVGCTVDLNGFKLTAANGKLIIISNKVFIKNGEILIDSTSSYGFITTKENLYSAEIEINNVSITADTANSGNIFTHNYGGISIVANNSTFTLTSRVNNYFISKNKAIFNNCEFNLNGKKGFTIANGTSSSQNYINFNSCTINDALTLFSSDAALTNYVAVTLANTKINNMAALSNFAGNAAFVKIANNSVLKNSDGTLATISAELKGSYLMDCTHSYLEANCLSPKRCEFCNLSEGNALGHTENTIITPSTCAVKGIIKTVCTTCNVTISSKTLPVLDHKYEQVKINEASCTKVPHTIWQCVNCNNQQQRNVNRDNTITRLKHTFDPLKTKEKAPTCTLGGYTEEYCTSCTSTFKTNNKLSTAHNFVAISEDESYLYYKCSTCTENYKEVLCDHTPDASKDVITAATCDTQGFTTHTCSLCAKVYNDTLTTALGHQESIIKGKEATCEETGLTDGKVCSRESCKKVIVEQQVIPALGHQEIIDSAVKATCTKTGLSEGKHCERCEKVLKAQETTPITDHLESQWIVDQKATCTTDGKQHKECVYCQVLLKEEVLKATGHNYTTDYVVIKQPTCTVEGEKQIYCLDCGDIKSKETVKKLAHKTTTKKAKKATYFEKGYTGDKVCKDCGTVISKGKKTDKLVLKVPKVKITASKGKLTFKYTKVADASGFEVKYSIGKKTYTKSFKTTKSATTYIKNLKKGNYKVQVRAFKSSKGTKAYSKFTKAKTYKVK